MILSNIKKGESLAGINNFVVLAFKTIKAEIKVIEMPEGLRRRATSKEMFWFNYGAKNVEVEGRSFPPQSVTRDVI